MALKYCALNVQQVQQHCLQHFYALAEVSVTGVLYSSFKPRVAAAGNSIWLLSITWDILT